MIPSHGSKYRCERCYNMLRTQLRSDGSDYIWRRSGATRGPILSPMWTLKTTDLLWTKKKMCYGSLPVSTNWTLRLFQTPQTLLKNKNRHNQLCETHMANSNQAHSVPSSHQAYLENWMKTPHKEQKKWALITADHSRSTRRSMLMPSVNQGTQSPVGIG